MKTVTKLKQPYRGGDLIWQSRPSRAHQNTGYVGSLSNWSGTPRQMDALSEALAPDADAHPVWKFLFAIVIGLTLGAIFWGPK